MAIDDKTTAEEPQAKPDEPTPAPDVTVSVKTITIRGN